MNKKNLFVQLMICMLMIGTLFLLMYINLEVYKFVMMCVGGYAVGTWCKGIADKYFPLR